MIPIRLLLVSFFALFCNLVQAETSVTIRWSPHADSNVVGYKLHYGTSSDNPDTVIDAGSALSTSISLQEGFTYYFSVSVYDIFGMESPRSNEVLFILGTLSPDHLIVVEPENGNISGSISGGLFLSPFIGFIETLNTDFGSTSIDFTAQSGGNYLGWMRVIAPDNSSDSIKVSIGTNPMEEVDLINQPLTNSNDWQWVPLITNLGDPIEFPMTAGSHTLNFETVDSSLLIDRLVFTSDEDFTPTDTNITNGDIIIISKHPEPVTAPAGASVSLYVSLISSGTPTFQWLKDGTPIEGETSSSLTITNLSLNDIGDYCVEILTPSSVVTSETAMIEIQQIQLPRLTSFEFHAGGGLEQPVTTVVLNLADNNVNASVKVLASSDLVSWEELGIFSLEQVNSLTVDDPQATSSECRFYKIVEAVTVTP